MPNGRRRCAARVVASVGAPFQGFDLICDVNPGRCPGLKLGRATEVGLARLRAVDVEIGNSRFRLALRTVHLAKAPKGRSNFSQGNALGNATPFHEAL
jgi:hypothetical protein